MSEEKDIIKTANESVEPIQSVEGLESVVDDGDIIFEFNDPLVTFFKEYCPEWETLKYGKRYTHCGRWPLQSHPGDMEGLLLIKTVRGPVFVTHKPGESEEDKEARISSYQKMVEKGKIFDFTLQFFTMLHLPLIDLMSVDRISKKPFPAWQEKNKSPDVLDPLKIAFPQTIPRFNVYREKTANPDVKPVEKHFVYYLTTFDSYFVGSNGKRIKVYPSASNDVLLGLIYEQLFHSPCQSANEKIQPENIEGWMSKENKRKIVLANYSFTTTANLLHKFQNFASLSEDKEKKAEINESISKFLKVFPNIKDFKTEDSSCGETICSVRHPFYSLMNKARLGLIDVILHTPQIYNNVREEYFEKEEIKIQNKSKKSAQSSSFTPTYKYLTNEQYNREFDQKLEAHSDFKEAIGRIRASEEPDVKKVKKQKIEED